MKGVAARYPAWDAAAKRPVNLEQRINACAPGGSSRRRSAREPGAARADRLRRAAVARMPIAVADDERMKPFLEAGRATSTAARAS